VRLDGHLAVSLLNIAGAVTLKGIQDAVLDNLLHRRIVNLTIFLRKGLLYGAHHNVRVSIGRGENQRFARKGRVDLLRQFLSDNAIEIGGYNLFVELLDLKVNFVGCMCARRVELVVLRFFPRRLP
jgi:hypothetical protein